MGSILRPRRAVVKRVSKYKLKEKDRLRILEDELKIKSLDEKCRDTGLLSCEIKSFHDLPLSERLSVEKYLEPTKIQSMSLPFSLHGRDVLGAAKTGSGKTLAFLIPILEKLYRLKWSKVDGLGALIITPTRELAFQIFKVLRNLGRFHTFSAGLLIGGKDMEEEKKVIRVVNILICTPGRLLGHMDNTADFMYDNMQILVLDEADRCLDEGFEKTLDVIISNLPIKRQTLLFSATQRKTVSTLARLSLKDPEYISTLEKEESSTPDKLIQKYIICGLEEKLDILFSFIKSHLKSKILVFVSTCKQVRFIHETFCKLRPGIIMTCLHGRQKQSKRLNVFETFSRKSSICLISTDVASRGLDFPTVDWVVQIDCPESPEAYIHRVGRTCRYNSGGEALTMILPSELAMLEKLEAFRIPIRKTKINRGKIMSITPQFQAYCTQFVEIKYLAQKAFVSYVRSIYLQKDKLVFDVKSIPIKSYAESLGLPGAPRIKILSSQKKEKNMCKVIENIMKESAGGEAEESSGKKEKKESRFKKLTKMFSRKSNTMLSKSYIKLIDTNGEHLGSSIDEEDFLLLKRKNVEVEDEKDTLNGLSSSVKRRRIQKEKKKELVRRGGGKHFTFSEDGEAIPDFKFKKLETLAGEAPLEKRREDYIEKSEREMKFADQFDKEAYRSALRIKKILKKKKREE